MNLDNYTTRARTTIQRAQTAAISKNHQRFTPEHLLYSLLNEEDGLIDRIIENCGADKSLILEKINEALNKIPQITGSNSGQLYLAPELARIFETATNLANKSGDNFVTTERLLQSLTVNKETEAYKILSENNITEVKIKAAIDLLRKGARATSDNAEDNFDALTKYAKDVTLAAKQGKLDPVIGRDEEIRRTMQVLSRRTKNNPVLIGEPGVGKTAIIEGLAQRIIAHDVPESLKNVKLMSLDLGALIAGAKFRGEFEERLKSVLSEIDKSNGEIILFIDELHTLIGAGASEGSMDASNLLKPALARGELHCVGATTLAEYQKYIEKDAALARRFQPIYVNEPTVEDTISILRGIKEKYELHHGIKIADNAIVAAATLSNRYITERFLPDKAIDLIDEAASRLRMQIDSKPEEIDELDRKIIQLKIEEIALEKEKDESSRDRLNIIKNELKQLESKMLDLSGKWQSERMKINELKNIRAKLDTAKIELENAQRSGDLNKAGELRYATIPELENKIKEYEDIKKGQFLQEAISENDIASIVSRWTGIPVDKMLTSEKEKLLKMENEIGKYVIGQNYAVKAVSDAVRRSRAGLSDAEKPIGSFLFLGPTGVGKTELTKALAQFLFNDRHSIVRIDMSEYMEKHAVARLIGAPPGYVGYEEGGVLTEAIRRRPYQIILFDEIEKAHPEVFNILLQLLDEGRLTDGKGRTVDFRHSVVILTSNLGSEYIAKLPENEPLENIKPMVMEIIQKSFKPEFINRLDEIILFHRLKKENMKDIVLIQIKRLEELLKSRRIEMKLSDKTVEWISEEGYDPTYGARPLKRVIQNVLQNFLSEKILAGEIEDGDRILIDISEKEGEKKLKIKKL